MKAKARLVSAMIGMAMVVAMFSGCGGQNTATKSSSTSKPVQLVMVVPSMAPNPIPSDWQAVEDAVNQITLKKINATVKIKLIPMNNYATQFNLMMSSGTKVDIMFVSAMWNTFTAPAVQGGFLPLGQLLAKYGQGITKVMDPSILGCGQINGKQYAVPLLIPYSQREGFSMRKDMVEKYNIDLSKIKTYQDFTSALATVKAHNPQMYPMTPNTMMSVVWYDQLGDKLGVLPNFNNNLKVVDLYETPQYAQMCKLYREWYLKGYIAPVTAATATTGGLNLIRAGNGFAGAPAALGQPNDSSNFQKATGFPGVTVYFAKPYISTFCVSNGMYAIPRSSQNPDKAMEFLNLLYTNKDIVNLLDYGIQGKDYVKTSTPGVIAYPPGTTPQNQYQGIGGFGFGNYFLSDLYNTEPSDLHQLQEAQDKSAVRSKALGFEFNPAPVKTYYAAVENVISQYATDLENGAVDPTTTLPKFTAALKAAGIDKIIAEKQKQLNAWAKTHNVQ